MSDRPTGSGERRLPSEDSNAQLSASKAGEPSRERPEPISALASGEPIISTHTRFALWILGIIVAISHLSLLTLLVLLYGAGLGWFKFPERTLTALALATLVHLFGLWKIFVQQAFGILRD